MGRKEMRELFEKADAEDRRVAGLEAEVARLTNLAATLKEIAYDLAGKDKAQVDTELNRRLEMAARAAKKDA